MNEGNILLIDLPATITIVAELVDLYNCNFWAETIEGLRNKVTEPVDLSGMSFTKHTPVDPKLVPEVAGQVSNVAKVVIPADVL